GLIAESTDRARDQRDLRAPPVLPEAPLGIVGDVAGLRGGDGHDADEKRRRRARAGEAPDGPLRRSHARHPSCAGPLERATTGSVQVLDGPATRRRSEEAAQAHFTLP